MYPVFCNPRKFAEISGINVKKVREYCRLQLIPNEKTNRDYRIIVAEALQILKERANEFAGHYYVKEVNFIAPPAPIDKRKKGKLSFIERCDALMKGGGLDEQATSGGNPDSVCSTAVEARKA